MTDDLEATPEVVEEVVQSEAEQVEAPEAAESTEGEPVEVTAEDKPEVEEPKAESEDNDQEKAKSRSERRREARERMQRELQESERARKDLESRLEKHKEAAKSLPRPKQEDYDDPDEFTAALSAYHSVQALDSREAQRLEAEAAEEFKKSQAIQQQQAEEAAQNWADQRAEAEAKYPDFEEVALHVAPINAEMGRQILQSDIAAELAYHIGKNPEIGHKMAEMEPMDVARALGRLEAQLSAPKPKTVSTAPDPITPVRGKSSVSKDPGEMTPQEYRAWVDAGGTF